MNTEHVLLEGIQVLNRNWQVLITPPSFRYPYVYLGNILGNKGKTGVKVFIGSFGVYIVKYKEIFIEDVNPLMLREA